MANMTSPTTLRGSCVSHVAAPTACYTAAAFGGSHSQLEIGVVAVPVSFPHVASNPNLGRRTDRQVQEDDSPPGVLNYEGLEDADTRALEELRCRVLQPGLRMPSLE
ncbi:hypothetical protein AK812_SmicGene33935 [Symbiodinium microadriaticum]|uniref:Uncharacterized protein n=1 Tax=Symbiodinium microadriaticum TaxID=2951 RepID=A0A1Q9CQA8_SYMMI|nr:hypothetical protein AK812_SmicGene33935 [Symbiodinium microadriaticum]